MKLYLLKLMTFAFFLTSITSCEAKEKVNPIAQKEVEVIPKVTKKETIKVALLLDTSSSMSGLINQAKAQLWEIVNELSYAKYRNVAPDLKIALYEYGNSRLSAENGYIKQVTEFTSDLDEVSEYLFAFRFNTSRLASLIITIL